MSMTELDKAYIAGFVDGEGCMGMYYRQGHIRPSFSVSNTNEKVINRIQSCLGGSKHIYKRKKQHWRDCYNLSFAHNKVEVILKKLLPYLVVKKKQAVIILSLAEIDRQWLAHKGKKRFHRWTPIPDVILELRKKATLVTKKLNGRSV